MRTPLVAGNWKMFKTVHEAVNFAKEFKSLVKDVSGVDIVIAPPFTAVHPVAEAVRASNIAVAAQDLFWEREGAFTGEVSAAMVREAGAAGISGVLHCYTGGHALAHTALDAGWYISFSGIVTFKKWEDEALLRLVPDDRVLAESDAPYLAPVPHRGKRNEPAWVASTVERLAAAREVTPEAMGALVTANALRFFSISQPSSEVSV